MRNHREDFEEGCRDLPPAGSRVQGLRCERAAGGERCAALHTTSGSTRCPATTPSGALFESTTCAPHRSPCGHFGGAPGGDIGTGGQAFSLIDQVLNGRSIPKGGSGMLSVALGRFIEAHNGVILTNKPVAQLIVEGGKCAGRGVRGRQQVSRRKSGGLHHPPEAHHQHGAARTLGRRVQQRDIEIFQPEPACSPFTTP